MSMRANLEQRGPSREGGSLGVWWWGPEGWGETMDVCVGVGGGGGGGGGGLGCLTARALRIIKPSVQSSRTWACINWSAGSSERSIIR